MRRSFSIWTSAVAALTLTACAVTTPIPTGHPATEAIPAVWSEPVLAGDVSASMVDWQQLITDVRLREVIALALANNRDLRVAVLTIEQARAAYRIQEAATLPTVNASAGASVSRTPAEASTTGQTTTTRSFTVGLGVTAYELDLFGRVRSLKDSALQSFLNTEAAQRSTRLSLVAETATAWLTLMSDQQQLALARETLTSQRATYQLTAQRKALGADSGLTLVQTANTVESARLSVVTYEAQVQRDRHALQLLVGRSVPDELLPSDAIGQAAVLVSVPAGLPSEVLQRRPDVLAAEYTLKGAQADINAARAALYPRISLTASAGTASRSLTDLFQGGAWSLAPTISWPIFDGGAAQATLRKAEITRDIRLASYDKTLQTAFSEVADALSVRGSLAERLDAQQALVSGYRQALRLATARYRAGADAYLTVLDAQRSLVAAQQALITLQLTEQTNRLTLYKVLGGGWGDEARPVAQAASAPQAEFQPAVPGR